MHQQFLFIKGDPSDCNNYHGISLINNRLKIITKIISNRISKYGIDEGFIRPEQYRFRNREECISLYTTLRIICQRQKFENKDTYLAFLNLEKLLLCVNIYVAWYRLYNFLLSGRDADIIDFNYKKEWNILFKNQIISGDYSKIPFLVRSAALFTEIMPRASTRQVLLFRKYKRKLTKVRQH